MLGKMPLTMNLDHQCTFLCIYVTIIREKKLVFGILQPDILHSSSLYRKGIALITGTLFMKIVFGYRVPPINLVL